MVVGTGVRGSDRGVVPDDPVGVRYRTDTEVGDIRDEDDRHPGEVLQTREDLSNPSVPVDVPVSSSLVDLGGSDPVRVVPKGGDLGYHSQYKVLKTTDLLRSTYRVKRSFPYVLLTPLLQSELKMSTRVERIRGFSRPQEGV